MGEDEDTTGEGVASVRQSGGVLHAVALGCALALALGGIGAVAWRLGIGQVANTVRRPRANRPSTSSSPGMRPSSDRSWFVRSSGRTPEGAVRGSFGASPAYAAVKAAISSGVKISRMRPTGR